MLLFKNNEESSYNEIIAWIKFTTLMCNKPEFNQYGVPLAVCYGNIFDAHYWEYIRSKL